MGPRASPSRTRSVSWCPRLGCSEQPFVVAGRGRAQLKYSAEDPSHSWAAGGEKPRDPKTTGRTRDRRRLGPGTGSKEAWEGRPLEADQDKEVPSRGARKKREQAAGIFFGPLTRETWRGLPYANRLRTPNEAFEIIRRLFHPPSRVAKQCPLPYRYPSFARRREFASTRRAWDAGRSWASGGDQFECVVKADLEEYATSEAWVLLSEGSPRWDSPCCAAFGLLAWLV